MAEKWNREDTLFLEINVNENELLSLIAKAKTQMETLNHTIGELQRVLEIRAIDSQNAPSKETEQNV